MKNKDLLVLSILTFLTVVAWIASDAYHASITSTLTSVETKLMEPFNPTFDKAVISQLKEVYGL